jgi:hypothetical protein
MRKVEYIVWLMRYWVLQIECDAVNDEDAIVCRAAEGLEETFAVHLRISRGLFVELETVEGVITTLDKLVKNERNMNDKFKELVSSCLSRVEGHVEASVNSSRSGSSTL